MVIGTNSYGYNQRRNFLDLPFTHARFKRVRDINWLPRGLFHRILGRVPNRLRNTFNDFGINSVSGYHFFNTITPSRTPWCVTFETSLPRQEPEWETGCRWLAAESCKQLIAISERARHLQMLELERFPMYRDLIASKLVVLHPSQMRLADAPRERPNNEIVATFVGGHFFRKGGLALLQAFRRLKQQGSDMRLNVVSSMQLCGWRDRFVTREVRREAMDLLAETPGVNYWPGLPAPDVMRLWKGSDIGVLPSYGETYGYSILEAMAHGCAAVVPRVSPFTEFVSDATGVLLDTPVMNDRGLAVMDFTIGHEALQRALAESLVSALGSLENNPRVLKDKGVAALQRVATYHCPQRAANRLEQLYLSTFRPRS